LRLVFDGGALIALERRKRRISEVVLRAHERGVPIVVPTVVIGEWWRGRTDLAEKILASVVLVDIDTRLAKSAGEALAAIPGATIVDALVMAVAARWGGIVYTSDYDDLTRLAAHFRAVRVLAA
jgi:hypothetical protein